ncbi:MAG: hypothetical protein RL708_91 [Bacteroidota bacterium]|jgi:CRP-like cAMP-binding protein
MHSFINEILNSSGFTSEIEKQLSANIVIKSISKGEVLLRKNDISSKSFFVKKGCLRSYSIDEKGKEHIFMFAPEGWMISDTPFEISNTKSQLFIDAIEDSEIEIIDNKLFEKLVTDLRLSNTIGLNKLLKRISVLQKRIILLMSASALERYQDFVATYPNIVQRVPQKMIASYLGITPEALSKIRGDFAKQK